MATFTQYEHGQFNWVDLMSKDIFTAKSFYGALFGWTSDDQDTQGGPPYVCFSMDGKQIAGLGEMNDEMKASGMPPVWNSYINVEDLNAAVAKITELGGNIMMPPMQVVNAGHMAVVQDPGGAVFSLWQKTDHIGAQVANLPNTWVWNELLSQDPDPQIEFYSKLFAWEFEKDETSPNDYWVFKNGGRMNGGVMRMPEEMQGVPTCWAVYFAVDDIDAGVATAKQNGGTVYRDPFQVSVGKIAVVADNQGAAFNLIQLTVDPDE